MLYTHDIAGCFGDLLSERIFRTAIGNAAPALDALREERKAGALSMLSVAESEEGLRDIEERATAIRKNFKTLYVLGTGGSSLTGQALAGLKTSQDRVRFITSIDPDAIAALLKTIDFKQSFFLVISKSGGTLETLAQALIFTAACGKHCGKEKIKEHFLFLSDPKESPLRRLSKALNIPVMDHHPKVGGRFSIFTNVGLLPAAVAGLDIAAIRKGAAEALQAGVDAESEPLKGAVLYHLLTQKKISVAVFMPYIDRLAGFTAWVRQVGAESLGKQGKGLTPATASGPLDQHSQLQLWLDGSRDKWLTLFTMDMVDKGSAFDSFEPMLKNKNLGDLLAAEQEATRQTLIHNSIPTRNFIIKKLDERALGALSMHMILETLLTAKLLGINPLDQPAVEEGKVIARKLLAGEEM